MCLSRSLEREMVGDIGLRKTTRVTCCGYFAMYFRADGTAPRQADHCEFFHSKFGSKGFNILHKIFDPQLVRILDDFGTPRSALVEHQKTVPTCCKRLHVIAADVNAAARPAMKKYNRVALDSCHAIEKPHPACTLEIAFLGWQIVVGRNS